MDRVCACGVQRCCQGGVLELRLHLDPPRLAIDGDVDIEVRHGVRRHAIANDLEVAAPPSELLE